MRNVAATRCREIKTHILSSTTSSENRAIYVWKNWGTAGQATYDNTIRRMRFQCWITNTANIHSEHVITIDFQEQQWLYKRASMLRLNVDCQAFYLQQW